MIRKARTMKTHLIIFGNITFNGENSCNIDKVNGYLNLPEEIDAVTAEVLADDLVTSMGDYIILPTYQGQINWRCDVPKWFTVYTNL